jgi:hypothetical protein
MLGLVRHARAVNNSLADLALFFASLLDPLIQGLQHPCIDCGDHIYGRVQRFFGHPGFPCVRKAPIYSRVAEPQYRDGETDEPALCAPNNGRSPAAALTRPLTFFPTGYSATITWQCFVSPALPLLLYLNNLSHCPQRLIYCLTIRKKLGDIGIKYDYVRAFRIPTGVLAANPAGKIVVITHLVVFTSGLLHISSAQGGLPSVR